MNKTRIAAMLCAVMALFSLNAATYGLPSKIEQGNILHCFNWSIAQVRQNLTSIAEAGYGSVQLSPLQRGDINSGENWSALYRPYDLAFKASPFMGSEADLKALCTEAHALGIKVIVDVVANHVDKTAGYHDTWWDSNGRVRWNGGINYGDRYSITHGQLGDYGDINSESTEVQERAKAYVQWLKNAGVDGIRWDAAKHIALPTESCGFWTAVTSVSGMWHYGEILDNPGPNASIIKEYANYMAVTDNQYSNGAAKDNGGIPSGFGGSWVVNHQLPDSKVVYWGESHDTYSNDEWSQNVDQSVIDRAYASIACRNGAIGLYLARPNAKGFNNIKVGKGTDAYKNKAVAEVNKFRNAMVGKADYFTNNGNAISVTRQNGGAVIVTKGSGNVSIANGGGYAKPGTYTDKVSGNTFTVTSSTISGNVGSTGIAVLYDGTDAPTPDDPNTDASLWILGNLGTYGWGETPGTGVAMTQNGTTYTAKNVTFKAEGVNTTCYFNLTDYVGATWNLLNEKANRYGAATEGASITSGTAADIKKYANNVDASGCLSWTVAPGTYDVTADLSTMKITLTKVGDNPTPDPEDNTVTIKGDYNLAYSGGKTYVYYWGSSKNSWPGNKMTEVTGSDGKKYQCFKVPAGTTNVIFNNGGDDSKTSDLAYTSEYIMDNSGKTTTAVKFESGDTPEPGGDEFVMYFDNTNSKWDNVTIWAWIDATSQNFTGGTWPGVAMESVGNNIYKWSTTKGSPDKVIFSNKGSNQTSDLAAKNGYVYYSDGTSHIYGSEPETLVIKGDYNMAYSGTKKYVYYWGSSKNSWPGNEMTKVTGSDGQTYQCFKLPEGTTNVIFNNGGDDSKTGDLTYKAGFVINDNGPTSQAVKFESGNTPDPEEPTDMPAKLYIIGDLNSWNPSTPVEMTKISSSRFQLADVNFAAAEESDYSYFSFCTQPGTTWDGTGNNDGVNDGYRYGPENKDELVSTSTAGSFIAFVPKVNASACTSFKVKAGKYAVTVDFATKKVILGIDVAVESIDADTNVEKEYFTLQGVHVATPDKGIYIVRQGNKVWKEVIK